MIRIKDKVFGIRGFVGRELAINKVKFERISSIKINKAFEIKGKFKELKNCKVFIQNC